MTLLFNNIQYRFEWIDMCSDMKIDKIKKPQQYNGGCEIYVKTSEYNMRS